MPEGSFVYIQFVTRSAFRQFCLCAHLSSETNIFESKLPKGITTNTLLRQNLRGAEPKFSTPFYHRGTMITYCEAAS
jgi:hypothetical protein